jgi:hypothetical protein
MPVRTRDNLGGSCGEGSLADPHSGRLGFPFRRYTEVFNPGLPRSSRHLNSQTSRPPCRSVRITLQSCINLPLSASNAKNCPQDLQVQFRHRLSTRNGNKRNKSRKVIAFLRRCPAVCHPELQDTPAHTIARLPFLCVSAKRLGLTAFCR